MENMKKSRTSGEDRVAAKHGGYIVEAPMARVVRSPILLDDCCHLHPCQSVQWVPVVRGLQVRGASFVELVDSEMPAHAS